DWHATTLEANQHNIFKAMVPFEDFMGHALQRPGHVSTFENTGVWNEPAQLASSEYDCSGAPKLRVYHCFSSFVRASRDPFHEQISP
ncbi:MAG: hypothetical protein ACI81L_003620, partial [Verrucomicrobiales bacterium]